MKNSIEKVLFTEEQIKARIKKLAKEITKDLQNEDVIVITVLKGAAMLSCDLVRELPFPVILDYISVSSYYSGTKSSGNVKIKKDTDINMQGHTVLIVEDIVDSGNTLAHLVKLFELRGAKQVRVCTLLDKPARRVTEVRVDYTGFDIPDEFVVGYGLDFDQQFRNLPYIGVLKPEVYTK